VDKGQTSSHLWIEKGNPRINFILVRGFFFRGRCSASNGCLLLVELTDSYAPAIKQQSVLLFYGGASGKLPLPPIIPLDLQLFQGEKK